MIFRSELLYFLKKKSFFFDCKFLVMVSQSSHVSHSPPQKKDIKVLVIINSKRLQNKVKGEVISTNNISRYFPCQTKSNI